MRLQTLLLSLAFGLCVQLLLTLIGGPYSQDAYRHLESYREALAANVEATEAAQFGLESQIDRLRNDPHLIEVEARRLLLYGEKEVVVYLSRSLRKAPSLSPGAVVVRQNDPPPDRRPLFRSIALVAALLCFLLLSLVEAPHRESSRRHSK